MKLYSYLVCSLGFIFGLFHPYFAQADGKRLIVQFKSGTLVVEIRNDSGQYELLMNGWRKLVYFPGDEVGKIFTHSLEQYGFAPVQEKTGWKGGNDPDYGAVFIMVNNDKLNHLSTIAPTVEVAQSFTPYETQLAVVPAVPSSSASVSTPSLLSPEVCGRIADALHGDLHRPDRADMAYFFNLASLNEMNENFYSDQFWTQIFGLVCQDRFLTHLPGFLTLIRERRLAGEIQGLVPSGYRFSNDFSAAESRIIKIFKLRSALGRHEIDRMNMGLLNKIPAGDFERYSRYSGFLFLYFIEHLEKNNTLYLLPELLTDIHHRREVPLAQEIVELRAREVTPAPVAVPAVFPALSPSSLTSEFAKFVGQ